MILEIDVSDVVLVRDAHTFGRVLILRTSQSLLQLSQLELKSQRSDTGVTRAVSWTKEKNQSEELEPIHISFSALSCILSILLNKSRN